MLAGLFVAVACAVLGVFLILRRDSMIGHGLAHVTFAGVALGLLLDLMPLILALVFAVLAGLLIMTIKDKAGLYGDTAIAIFSSTGFALGIIIVSISQDFNVDLFGYLFGEILAIKTAEVWLSVLLALLVVLFTIVFYGKFLYMTFDRESALVAGIRVTSYEAILTILTAVTVVLGMKVVGILLVSALLVIPAAAGLQLARNFKQAIFFAVFISITSVLAGLIIAFYMDFPASGTIVVLSFIFFALALLWRRK